MKKTVLVIGLAACLLAACGKSDKKTTTSSTEGTLSSTLPILEEKQNTSVDILANLISADRVVANPTPPEDETQKGHKIHAAANWVAEKDEAGNIKENFRYYDVPANWTINAENTTDETQGAVYDVKEGQSTFMVQIYMLNAFTVSPLENGVNMNDQELEARMVEAQLTFVERTTVTIEGQEWKVGRQFMTDQKMGRITFYRMENTGAYDDSVVVASVYYPLSSDMDKDRSALRQTIGQMKDVVYQISKK